MKAIRNHLIVIAALVVVIGISLYAGIFNVAADDPHWSVTRNLLETVRERSIAARSSALKPPNLDDPALIAMGAEHYSEMCTGCHLAPGMEETEIRAGLYPKPPNLVEHGAHLAPEQAFWIIKHGIKMTGMPAWGVTHDDQAIWGMVAFLRKLPSLDAEQYEALTAESEGTEHSHEEGEHNDESASGKPTDARPNAAAPESKPAPHQHKHGDHDHGKANPRVSQLSHEASEAAATVDRFQQLLASGKTKEAAALLDPEVLIYEGGGSEKSRAEYASHHLAADAEFLKDAKYTVVARTGDAVGDLAWVASESSLSKSTPKALNLSSTETMVLRKRADGWRIAHIHWSSKSD